MNAIDTNVLVYFVDFDAPAKQAKAVDLLERLGGEQTETVLPCQMTGEFLSCRRRWENKGRIDWDDAHQRLSQLGSMFRLVFPVQSVLRLSLERSSR